jgi:hypothetical protein
MDDPFKGTGGETRPDAEREGGLFWKPSAPSYMVGRLDRVEPGKKYGDFAVFAGAVVFRADDHRPIGTGTEKGELAIGLSGGSLAGKITPDDVGTYFRVQFDKWVPTEKGKMRVFIVTAGLEPVTTEATLTRARKMVARDLPVALLSDDLPY